MKYLKHLTAFMACFMFCIAGHAVQIRREPGHRIPESIIPTDLDNPALWERPSGPFYTRAAAPGDYSVSDIPRLGTIEYPLVLVEFSNLTFSIQDKEKLLERYERMFNRHGYSDTAKYIFHGNKFEGATGSVSDYFRHQSYGQYIPKFRIIGPIHLSREYSYYGNSKYDKNAHVDELVREICDSIISNEITDLSGYAVNGHIYQLSIIYSGKGENYTGSDENTIWPQASIYYPSGNDSLIRRKGIKSIRYACTCELFWDSDTIPDGIGTFCHEFSHTLGLPDFYNTAPDADNEANAAMGFWSLMDYGNYENLGFSPVGYTAFEKYSLGWINLEEIKSPGLYYLYDISRKPAPDKGRYCAYRLNTGDDSQFIILENHIKTGWYKYHKAEGLMVTAVDYSKSSWTGNTVNREKKQYRILPADNDYNRNTNAGDLFPFQDKDSITTLGKPTLKAGESYPSLSIYRIIRDGNKISFRLGYDQTSKVQGLQKQDISINLEGGVLSVAAPSGSTVTIHDISGKPVQKTVTTAPVQQIPLPGQGLWIVKCGNVVRKVRK